MCKRFRSIAIAIAVASSPSAQSLPCRQWPRCTVPVANTKPTLKTVTTCIPTNGARPPAGASMPTAPPIGGMLLIPQQRFRCPGVPRHGNQLGQRKSQFPQRRKLVVQLLGVRHTPLLRRSLRSLDEW